MCNTDIIIYIIILIASRYLCLSRFLPFSLLLPFSLSLPPSLSLSLSLSLSSLSLFLNKCYKVHCLYYSFLLGATVVNTFCVHLLLFVVLRINVSHKSYKCKHCTGCGAQGVIFFLTSACCH